MNDFGSNRPTGTCVLIIVRDAPISQNSNVKNTTASTHSKISCKPSAMSANTKVTAAQLTVSRTVMILILITVCVSISTCEAKSRASSSKSGKSLSDSNSKDSEEEDHKDKSYYYTNNPGLWGNMNVDIDKAAKVTVRTGKPVDISSKIVDKKDDVSDEEEELIDDDIDDLFRGWLQRLA